MITAPRNIYGLNFFLRFYEELGFEKVREILDVSESTLRRWLRGAIPVPKIAVLALYWETAYGRSVIDTDHFNEVQNLYGYIRIIEQSLQDHKAVIAGLRKFTAGSANEPYFPETREHYALPESAYEFALPTANSAVDLPASHQPASAASTHAQAFIGFAAHSQVAAHPKRQKIQQAG